VPRMAHISVFLKGRGALGPVLESWVARTSTDGAFHALDLVSQKIAESLADGRSVPKSRPASWDLLSDSWVEDGRLHPNLAGSSFAVEKLD